MQKNVRKRPIIKFYVRRFTVLQLLHMRDGGIGRHDEAIVRLLPLFLYQHEKNKCLQKLPRFCGQDRCSGMLVPSLCIIYRSE